MKFLYYGFGLFLFGLLSSFNSLAQDISPIELAPCFISHISEKSQCATVKMPLDHRGAVEGDIDIFVGVVPALSSQILEDPLVLFSGGPGQATSEMGGLVKLAFKSIREHREIILIDQRGTGKSTPLRCEGDADDTVYDAEKHVAEIKACRANFDIAAEHFTMENVVADTHEILKRLGYERVNLWGASWGTRTAVHYLRRHPEYVRSVVVDGVLPPDVAVFNTSPASGARAMNMMIDACNSDVICSNSYPDLGDIIDELINKSRDNNLVFYGADPVSGEQITRKISWMLLVQNIRAILYTPQKATMLPMALDKLNKGDARAFMALTADGGLSSKSMYIGSTLSLLCGEEVPRMSDEQRQKNIAEYFTEDSYYQYWSTACNGWPSLAGDDDIHDTYESDVPMLILSGELDPVTPPSMGDHLAKSFANSKHFVVEGVGHNVSYHGCMPKILGEFLENTDVSLLDATCLDKMRRPAFVVPVAIVDKGEDK